MQITAQEAWVDRTEGLWIPPFIAASVEAVAFAARDDRRIDQNSGVSQRLAISLMELVASNAEQRALRYGELPVARPLDLYRGAPAVSGKVELEYEGEMVGAERIVRDLILAAFANAFGKLSRGIDTNKIVEWFESGNYLKISEGPASTVVNQMQAVPGLVAAARKLAESSEPERVASAGEFILEGLAGRKKLSRGEESYSAASPSESKKRWGN
jgi:magnesium chelatase subunit I